MRAQITPMTFAGFLADGSKVTRGSQKYTYWQELALARGTIAMAANQSITMNVGALSNAIAVAIQQATTDSDARGSASGGAAAVPVAPAAVPVAPSSSGHGVGPYGSGSGTSTSSQNTT